MTSPVSSFVADFTTDIQRQMERLEAPEGTLGSRFVTRLQNEVNRFINIFATREFSTDSQIYVLLDKEITNLSELITKHEKAMGEKSEHTNPEWLRENQRMRESIQELTGKFEKMMKKTQEVKGRKELKELLSLREHLSQLTTSNTKEIERDTQLLQSGLNARESPAREILQKEALNVVNWVVRDEEFMSLIGHDNARFFTSLAADNGMKGSSAETALKAQKAVVLIETVAVLADRKVPVDIQKGCREILKRAEIILDLEEIYGNPIVKEESRITVEDAKRALELHYPKNAIQWESSEKIKKANAKLKKILPELTQRIVSEKKIMSAMGQENYNFLQALAAKKEITGSPDEVALKAQRAIALIQFAAEFAKTPLSQSLLKDCQKVSDHVDAIQEAKEALGFVSFSEDRKALIKSTREELQGPSEAVKTAALAILLTAKELQERLKKGRIEIKNELPKLAETALKNKELLRFVTDSEKKVLQGIAQSRGLAGSPLQVAMRGQEATSIIAKALAAKKKMVGAEGIRDSVNKIDTQIATIFSSEELLRKQTLYDEVTDLLWELVPQQLKSDEMNKLPLEKVLQIGNSVVEAFDKESKTKPLSKDMQEKVDALRGHLEEFRQMGLRRKELQEEKATQATRQARKDLGKELLEPVINKGVALQKKAKIMHVSEKAQKAKKHVITQEMLTKALVFASQHQGRGLKKTLNALAKQAPIPIPRQTQV